MQRRRFARPSFTAALLIAALGCESTATDATAQEPPRAPLAVFGYDRAAPLALESTPAAATDATVDVHVVSFASPGGGRVTGMLAVPKSPGRHPGVVVMHGLPGHASGAMSTEGMQYATRGAVTLAIDAPWVRRGGIIDLTPRDSVEQVQLMQDLQRAVDVLLARADVDSARIAYVGGSYGGAMGALFVGIERRLRAAVLFVPDGGLVAHFTGGDGTVIGPLSGAAAPARDRWLAAMRPIEPIRFVADAPPTELLFQNGRTDELVTIEDAEDLHRVAREPKTIRWYDAGHGLTPAARADRVTWLFERLGR